eukprot:Pompholyxophrys_punicea_v1_NODE_910_length_1147_cov_2.264652.p1 type:complete len:108 gc:universal NODE_910_length_1147_cov_2.264652:120-443(+)
MHVVLEGGFPTELNLFLKYAINEQKKFFKVQQFNNRLDAFNFGYMHSNSKPSPLKKKLLLNGFFIRSKIPRRIGFLPGVCHLFWLVWSLLMTPNGSVFLDTSTLSNF